MKKLALALLMLLLTTTTVFAQGVTQQLFYFAGKDEGVIKEINYYLAKGAKVSYIQTVPRSVTDGMATTVVLDIPTEVFENQPYSKK